MSKEKTKIVIISFTTTLFFLISTRLIGQVCEVIFIDTNLVKKYYLESAVNYDLDIAARKNGAWKYEKNNKTTTTCLINKLDNKLIFKFIEYSDSSILEKKYYPNNKLESVICYSRFITIDSMQRGDEDHPLVPVIFIVELKPKNGIYKTYYPNGNIKQNGQYYSLGWRYDELKEGTWKEYYENGRLKSMENYIRKGETCILKGKYLKYFENGNKKLIGHYNSKLANKSYCDSIRRIKRIEDIWIGGIKDGKWKEYNEKGELIKNEIYKNGVLVEEKKKKLKNDK